MADIKVAYGSSTSIDITLASLADSATVGRESTVVSNAANLFLDAHVSCKFKPQNSGSITAPSVIYVWAYASIDGGTTYTDTATGTDAACTINNPNQLRLLGVVNVAAINTTYKAGPWSVAQAFGGKVPQRWGVIVVNDCGTALSSTEGDHDLWYQGITSTVA